ncbi:hypothetical protein V492_02651 [Pseudogymnoascus sp. VKM F-4246]|nr:hypothetical protein V492_02651 [Pseudogymnoascus sp. VKM F-4246]
MSNFTKVLHRKNYAAIDAASPEQSQAGRNILITGGSDVIGRAAAQGFVTAGADVVAITSRSEEKASRVAKEIEAVGKGTKVLGYQYEIGDEASVNALWDNLKRDGVEIDVLILNTSANIPTAQEHDPSISKIWKIFESNVKNQLINVDRFQQQGKKAGKVLLYISTNGVHFSEVPVFYLPSGSTRIAVTRLLQDLAVNTPVDEMQIISMHPGLIFTSQHAQHGVTRESLPFDDASLPGNFYVWAATRKAAFLHGRFVWTNWDVDELIAMKPKIDADKGLLRVGLQGVESQDFEMLFAGLNRSVRDKAAMMDERCSHKDAWLQLLIQSGKRDMARLTLKSARPRKAIQDSLELAEKHAHSLVLPLHLAVSLIDPLPDTFDSQLQTDNATDGSSFLHLVIEKAHGDPQIFDRAIKKAMASLPSQDPPPDQIAISPAFVEVLKSADKLQETQGDSYIAVDHVVTALSQNSSIQEALSASNVASSNLVQDAVQHIRGARRIDSRTADAGKESEILKKYTVDMTTMARNGQFDPVIEREEEIGSLIRILAKRSKNNPLLVGEPGVGKTTMVEGLAQRIVRQDVPYYLATCKLLSLDANWLVAGAECRGEVENRMMSVLKEIETSPDSIILFIDDIHLLMGTDAYKDGGMDAVSVIKAMLSRGQLHFIAATGLDEYRTYFEKDAAFERHFKQVFIKEPSITETISILRSVSERYESHHGVTITNAAIVLATNLAAKYLTARRLPDSVIDLIDESAAAVRVAKETKPEIIDTLERKLRQLKFEIHALSREKDEASKTFLGQAKQGASNIEEELRPLRIRYEDETKRDQTIQAATMKLNQLKFKGEEAHRTGDLQKAAEIRYAEVPEQEDFIKSLKEEKRLAELSRTSADTSGVLAGDTVGPDQIMEVVVRWTGIPLATLNVP